MEFNQAPYRKTSQFLMPQDLQQTIPGRYNIYPTHNLPSGSIHKGIASLSDEIAKHSMVLIDGYQGVFFDVLKKTINLNLKKIGLTVNWINIETTLKPPEEIERLIRPFLGGDDPLFGTRATLDLVDFFDFVKIKSIEPDQSCDVNIIYGPGAALFNQEDFLIYVDLPKNEMQFRARAKTITNLGAAKADDIKPMYKRFYFVDWVVLNHHKESILQRIDIFADGQHPDEVNWAFGNSVRDGLNQLSRNVFRVRPWFEPGTWGGTWCLDHIEGLNKAVPNYAWSFELIVPENGLEFESSGLLLEISFDCLMFQEAKAVLGDAFQRFGTNFPIRFDFLDTFDGGNLSVQCHPQQNYTKQHFGEDFTQEECYYILDSKEQAVVYLGFQENIDPEIFKQELEDSYLSGKTIEVEKFVQVLPAEKHDFFLIPPGTIHASGKNNLVLEISTTPYIFTFKMYDWLRPDLDGKPRPLNISRAMQNLCFDRKGPKVKEELISRQRLIDHGEGWEMYHLPTHQNHLYDVHRIKLTGQIEIQTDHKCHVLSLVEGRSIVVETKSGQRNRYNYAETFVVPAAAGSYTIINENNNTALIIKAFVK